MVRFKRPGNRAGGWRTVLSPSAGWNVNASMTNITAAVSSKNLQTDLQDHTVSNRIFGAIKTSNLMYYERSETQRDIRRASCRSANYLECLSGSPTVGKVPADIRITLRTEFSFFTQLVYTAYAWNATWMSKHVPINITSDKKSPNMNIEPPGHHTTDRSTLMKPVVRLSYRKWGKSRDRSRFLYMTDIL